ncbi:hypothetical protein H072_4481 [Dactylellina haptotyla CBS 200.50]|uniref:Uncharacterized protein n=1 Tax=Dactylellina haptotyla (strain CBS 200.50) TaxID=1284197 RepID=S8C1Z6_DACHA|nr:hypothetical protein H072_4481 [Dactylellina haptotyla CBS 200.50]
MESRKNPESDDCTATDLFQELNLYAAFTSPLSEEDQAKFLTCPGAICNCDEPHREERRHCPQLCNCPLLVHEERAKRLKSMVATCSEDTESLPYEHPIPKAARSAVLTQESTNEHAPDNSSAYAEIIKLVNPIIAADILGCSAATCTCDSKYHKEGRHCPAKCDCVLWMYEYTRHRSESATNSYVKGLRNGTITKNDYIIPPGTEWVDPNRESQTLPGGSDTSQKPSAMHASVYQPNNGNALGNKSRLTIPVNATFPAASFDRPGGNPEWSLKEITNSRKRPGWDTTVIEYAAIYVFANGDSACPDPVWHTFDELNFPWGIRVLRIFHRRYILKPKDKRVDDRSLVEWTGARHEWFSDVDLYSQEQEKKSQFLAFRSAQEDRWEQMKKQALGTAASLRLREAQPKENMDMEDAPSLASSSDLSYSTGSDLEMWNTYEASQDQTEREGSINFDANGTPSSEDIDQGSPTLSSTAARKSDEDEAADRKAWMEKMKTVTEFANISQTGNGTNGTCTNGSYGGIRDNQSSKSETTTLTPTLSQETTTLSVNNPRVSIGGKERNLDMISEQKASQPLDIGANRDEKDPLASKRSRGSAGSHRGDLKRAKFSNGTLSMEGMENIEEPVNQKDAGADTYTLDIEAEVDKRDSTKEFDNGSGKSETEKLGCAEEWRVWNI